MPSTPRDDLADLSLFQAIAEHGSFTAAARRLNQSQSAVSHRLRRLETRLGLRLLTRTTRSVAPTEAGERLLEVLQPALESIEARLRELNGLRERPAGRIRLSAPEHVAQSLLWPAVDRLCRACPEIQVEINVEPGFIDIVRDRYDAGVRLGEAVPGDMIAVPIGPPLRMLAFAAPEYLARRGRPTHPRQLTEHQCINLRFSGEGRLYAWEFERDGQPLQVRVGGQLTFNRSRQIMDAAIAGHGIGFLPADRLAEAIAAGQLEPLLQAWCPPFPGYHLYYPMRRQPTAAFRRLIDTLRTDLNADSRPRQD